MCNSRHVRGFLQLPARRWFVEQDFIEGVIYLPQNLSYNTNAPGVLIFLNKAKSKERLSRLFLLNASREFVKGEPKTISRRTPSSA
jgi:type I restriction enzyme M protein